MNAAEVMIRRGRADDALEIAALVRQVWPNDTADVERIAGLLDEQARATHVATIGRQLIGFVDGFVTRAQDGSLRWEVDMLAVAPECRGQGVATRLIMASTALSAGSGVAVARGLVRADNRSAQVPFSRAGYTRDDCLSHLLVSSEDVWGDPVPPESMHIVPVRTFTYRGFWIEGNQSVAIFEAARRYRMVFDADVVGAVISLHDESALQAAHVAGYEHAGDFYWWHRPLK